MTKQQLHQFTEGTTREVPMPDGTTRMVTMSADMWEEAHFIKVMDGITLLDVSGYALEEMELQGLDWDAAFQCIVAYFTNRWTP
ncbi:MAG: hypothetical protein R3C19_25620 [Planctomycetaceae bacterium]